MDKLGIFAQPFEELGHQRTLYACPVENFEDLLREIQPTSRYFGLFLALDGRGGDDDLIRSVADGLVAKGLASCCVWGPECEPFHDLVDGAAFAENSLNEGRDDVIMTTWHDHDTLPEALWYFVECAIATPKYEATCTDWIAASVGSTEWADVIRNGLIEIVKRSQSAQDEDGQP
jgi:hypothetical protein